MRGVARGLFMDIRARRSLRMGGMGMTAAGYLAVTPPLFSCVEVASTSVCGKVALDVFFQSVKDGSIGIGGWLSVGLV